MKVCTYHHIVWDHHVDHQAMYGLIRWRTFTLYVFRVAQEQTR